MPRDRRPTCSHPAASHPAAGPFPPWAAAWAEDLAPEDFRHVIQLLRDDVTRLLEVMENAARDDDAAAFRRAAHGMTGAAGAIAATALEQASRLAMTRHDIGDLAVAAAGIRGLAEAMLAELAMVAAGVGGGRLAAPP